MSGASDLAAFADACKQASRGMRRLPSETRKALAHRVRPEVADPLADRVRASYRGPWARALSLGTKTRVQTDPQLVVGGTRRVVSGGASARQLVYGAQWGGGKKVRSVSRQTPSGRVSYRRRTTQQFRRATETIFPTIHRSMDDVLERFARIVQEVIDDGS